MLVMRTTTGTPAVSPNTGPYFSEAAIEALLEALKPDLPPPPKRGPAGMGALERVRAVLLKHREGLAWRGVARVYDMPESTLRSALRPVRKAFEKLLPLLPDGTPHCAAQAKLALRAP